MGRIHYRLDYDDGGTWKDITDRVYTIDKFTSAGTGEIVSAQIMLDARFDNFVTGSEFDDDTATPEKKVRFDQFDEFRLTVWQSFKAVGSEDDDPAGGFPTDHYQRILILDNISPQKNDEGAFLLLDLFGRERYLQKMFFTGRYFWTSFQDMVETIIDAYNDNKGAAQPTIEYDDTSLDIPSHTIGTFEFGDNHTAYECLMDVVTRLELPVASGGGGTPYIMIFEDDGDDLKLIIRPLGEHEPEDSTFGHEDTPIGQDTNATFKPISLTEVKNPIRGNVVRVTGADNHGTFPSEIADFRSSIEEYTNLPLWRENTKYVNEAIVRHQNAVYRSTTDDNTDTPSSGTNWEQIRFNEYRKGEYNDPLDTTQYSPFTHDKHALFKNYAGGRKNGTTTYTLKEFEDGDAPSTWKSTDCVAFPDSNLVIRDGNAAWRDHVDFRITSSTQDIPSYLKYDGDNDNDGYFGLTALIVGNNIPSWVSSDTEDKNGRSYENALIQQDRDGDWIVFRNAEDHDECAVLDECKVYEYTRPLILPAELGGNLWRVTGTLTGTRSWVDITKTPFGADCFHWPYSIEKADSLLVTKGTGMGTTQTYVIGDSGGRISANTNDLFNLNGNQQREYFQDSALKIVYKSGLDEGIIKTAKVLIQNVTEFAEDLVGDISAGITTFIATGDVLKSLAAISDGIDSLYEFVSDTADSIGKFENMGWWCTLFEAPFPKTTLNGITESVGELYGGGDGESTSTKTPYLDLQNLTVTPSGKKGFKHADSNELTQTFGITFLFNFDVTLPSVFFTAGNLPFRCTMYDIFGNVWVADIAIRFQNETQHIILPWTAFSIYRARTPVSLRFEEAVQRFINPELRITEVFFRQFVKRITFQYQHPYDDVGTFDPLKLEVLLDRLFGTSLGTITYTGIIDAFGFITKAVAIAKDEDDHDYNMDNYVLDAPQKNYPGVSNVRQLQKVAEAELTRSKFRFDYWTIKVPGQTNLVAGDGVYVYDKHFVNDEGNKKLLYVRQGNLFHWRPQSGKCFYHYA